MAVEPLAQPAPEDDRLCPVCGDPLVVVPELAPELAAIPEATPGELDAWELILAAQNVRRCLEGTLAGLPAHAGEEEVEAMLLYFWLAGDAEAELRGISRADAFERVLARAEAAGELRERIESLWACVEAAVAYGGEKCPAKLQPETPIDYVRVALAGLKHKRVSAHWTGRRPPGPDAMPRRPPKLEERDEASGQRVERVCELLKKRDVRGRRLGERTIAERAGVSRETVRRIKSERSL